MTDVSSEDSLLPAFELIHNNEIWEVPLEAGGAPENPVPFGQGGYNGADDSLFGAEQSAVPSVGNGHLNEAVSVTTYAPQFCSWNTCPKSRTGNSGILTSSWEVVGPDLGCSTG